MKKISICLILGLSITSLTACSCFKSNNQMETNNQKPQAFRLKNTSWALVRIDSQDRDFKSVNNSQIKLTFGEDTVNTSDGCNGIGGTFEQNNNYISFGEFMSTAIYCTEEYMKENGYSVPIQNTEQFSVENDILKIYDKDTNVIATYKRLK